MKLNIIHAYMIFARALSTQRYIHIEQALFKEGDDKFTVMAVRTSEEIKSLLEVGFEYVCQKDDLVFLRKRK